MEIRPFTLLAKMVLKILFSICFPYIAKSNKTKKEGLQYTIAAMTLLRKFSSSMVMKKMENTKNIKEMI